jgi:hypothetical protein
VHLYGLSSPLVLCRIVALEQFFSSNIPIAISIFQLKKFTHNLTFRAVFADNSSGYMARKSMQE